MPSPSLWLPERLRPRPAPTPARAPDLGPPVGYSLPGRPVVIYQALPMPALISTGRVLLTSGGALRAPLLESLVSFWEFEAAGNLGLDSFGTNHLTNVNSVSQAAGLIGNAGSFVSASSQYLSLADNAALSMGTGVWYFLAGGWDGANVWISRNNAGTVTSALANGVQDAAFAFNLGAFNAANFLNGQIDSAGIWKRTLTAAELTFLWNSGAGRTYAEIAAYGG
jgi:hypothetical protein